MENNKVCPKCKKVFPSNAAFCDLCGTRLIEINNNQQQTGNIPNNNNQNNGVNPDSKNTNKKALYIGLIAIAAVIVLLIGYGIGHSGNNDDDYISDETTAVYETDEPETEETTQKELKGVSSTENYLYGVGDGYDGGAVYLMMYFECDDTDFDGYEVKMTNPYSDNDVAYSFFVDKNIDCVYYSSQDPCFTVEIRTYRGNPAADDAQRSDWFMLCDQEGANSLFSSQVNMTDSEWESNYADKGFELDYYNLD